VGYIQFWSQQMLSKRQLPGRMGGLAVALLLLASPIYGQQPKIKVEANALEKEYAAAHKALAANPQNQGKNFQLSKYFGKQIQVSGKVLELKRIEKSTGVFITFEVEGDCPVCAHFMLNQQKWLKSIKKGDEVEVRG